MNEVMDEIMVEIMDMDDGCGDGWSKGVVMDEIMIQMMDQAKDDMMDIAMENMMHEVKVTSTKIYAEYQLEFVYYMNWNWCMYIGCAVYNVSIELYVLYVSY